MNRKPLMVNCHVENNYNKCCIELQMIHQYLFVIKNSEMMHAYIIHTRTGIYYFVIQFCIHILHSLIEKKITIHSLT